MADILRATEFPDGITFGDILIMQGMGDPASEQEVAPIGSFYFSTTGKTWRKFGAGNADWTEVGEVNTSSNVAPSGVAVFKQKTGVDFEFKSINAGSDKITITDDTANDEIDIDVVQANLAILQAQITDLAAFITASSSDTLTNKEIDADGTGNVITNVGSSEIKPEIITGLTEKVSPAAGDFLMGIDASGNLLKKFDSGNLPSAGGGDTLPVPDTTEVVKGSSDTTKRVRIEADLITTGNTRVITMADNDVDLGEMVSASGVTTFTNKIFDENGVGNQILNVADSSIAAHTSTKITIVAKNQLNSAAAYEDDANTWGGFDQNIAASGKWQEGGVDISPIGLHDVHVASTCMWPPTASGCAPLAASVFGEVEIQTLDFDAGVPENAQFRYTLPRTYDNGTIEFIVHWGAASGSGGVTWGLKIVATGDGENIDAAFGTEITVDDTLSTANTERISPVSTAVTIAGTPAKKKSLHFNIQRKTADANDTLGVDAKLIGIDIYFSTDAAIST